MSFAGAGMKDQPHATLLTSLRGWACGFASRAEHNTHSCAYNSGRIAPAPPSRETSSAGIICCTMRRCVQLRRPRLSRSLFPGPRIRPGQCARQRPRHPSRQRPRNSPMKTAGLPRGGEVNRMVLAADAKEVAGLEKPRKRHVRQNHRQRNASARSARIQNQAALCGTAAQLKTSDTVACRGLQVFWALVLNSA